MATAVFLEAWRRSGRLGVALVKVELRTANNDGAVDRTLYLASRDCSTPDGLVWEGVLKDADVSARCSFAGAGFELAAARFEVETGQALAYQAAGKTFAAALVDYRWIGASVEIWLWELGLLDNANNAALQFRGVVQSYRIDASRVVFACTQRTDWNREIPEEAIGPDKYPRSPEVSRGRFPAICYGALLGIPLHVPPWTAPYGNIAAGQHGLEHIGGGRRAVPGLVVDVGRGGQAGGDSKIVVASHPCKTFNDTAKGCSVWLEQGGKLCTVEPVGTFSDATDGTGFKIADKPSGAADPFTTVFIPVLPSNVELISPLADNAENPRAVLDPFEDTGYAVLDWAAGNKELRVRMPSAVMEGDLVSPGIDIFCGIHLVAGSISNVRLRLLNTVGSHESLDVAPGLFTTNPGYAGLNLGAVWSGTSGLPGTPWQFGDCVLRIYIVAASTTVRVYALGITVRVRPRGELVGSRFQPMPVAIQYRPRRRNWLGYPSDIRLRPFTRIEDVLVPMYGPIAGGWAANLEGWADDGSGTYTGSASALIERAPDIAHHLLVVYGGQTGATINTAASPAFGSFVTARSALGTWRGGAMIHAVAVIERVPIQRLLESMAADALCMFYLDRFTDKFHCIPWRTAPAMNYARLIPKAWLSDERLTVDAAPTSDLVTGVTMPYSHDYVSKSPLYEITVGRSRSSSGHRYRKIRDQQMTVIASGAGQNNKLDFTSNATYAITLGAGDYGGMGLAVEVGTKMGAADGGQHPCSYGPEVFTGWNDTVRFYDGTSNKTATIVAAAYASFEDLAAAIVTAVNAVIAAPANAIASFSRTTRKLTIGRSSGTFSLLWLSGNATTTRARVLVGAGPADQTGSTSYEMAYEREEQRFAIGDFVPLALLWETGANGLNAGLKNCAALLGFDTARDSTVAGQSSYLGHSPKGDREWRMAATATRYGNKSELTIPGTTVWDDDTARQASHLALDLLSNRRLRIRFSSAYLPDLERGRIIGFEQDVDDIMPYPQAGLDGSWLGKTFVVTETRQSLGPDSFTTDIVAVEL